MTRSPHRSLTRTLVPAGGLAALTAVAVLGGVTGGLGGGDGTGPDTLEAASLSSFSSCDELLTHLKAEASRIVGPYGLPGAGAYPTFFGAEVAMADMATEDSRSTGAATGTNGAGTGTNVQVGGVDEADLVKVHDGRLLTVTDGVLRVSTLDGGRPEVVGSLKLTDWYPEQMLVTGDRVLLVGSGGNSVYPAGGDVLDSRLVGPDVMPWMPTTRLAEVDLSDPTAPTVRHVVDLDGTRVGARLVEGTATVALTSSTGRLPWVMPANDNERAAQAATTANKALIAGSTITDWLPTYTEDGEARPLLDCADVAVPDTFAGLDVLSMMSIDLGGGGLVQWDSTGVLASGSTLYATAEHTYVATSPWQDWAVLDPAATRLAQQTQRTQVHLFATAPQDSPRYVATTEVPGFLLGQFALDEHEGTLRIASTTQPAFGLSEQEEPAPSQSRVSTFAVQDDALAPLGEVTGLGVTETIRGVRFLGDVGYVVTFRQTDPLYTIDLSEPSRPTVAGELKILGYSAYLHPAGDGLLLGLGQDATKDGQTTGLQLSLFDVSDPADPRRVDQVTVDGAWSDVEGDHHAFTFVDGLALAPYQLWGETLESPGTEKDQATWSQRFDSGVLAVRVAGGELSDPTTLRTVADGPLTLTSDPQTGALADETLTAVPLRTVVVDGVVYTVTSAGVAAHDAGSLERITFTRF